MHTTITNKTIAADTNDNFRLAFNRLNRVLMPVLCKSDRFEADQFYYTDIMHDAAAMAALKNGESRWIMLTSSGTFMFNTGKDMMTMCAEPVYKGMAVAIFCITCTRAEHEYLPAVWDIKSLAV